MAPSFFSFSYAPTLSSHQQVKPPKQGHPEDTSPSNQVTSPPAQHHRSKSTPFRPGLWKRHTSPSPADLRQLPSLENLPTPTISQVRRIPSSNLAPSQHTAAMPLRKTRPPPLPSIAPDLAAPTKAPKSKKKDDSSFLPFDIPRTIVDAWNLDPAGRPSRPKHAHTHAPPSKNSSPHSSPPPSAATMNFDRAVNYLSPHVDPGRSFSPFPGSAMGRGNSSPPGSVRGMSGSFSSMPSIEGVMEMETVVIPAPSRVRSPSLSAGGKTAGEGLDGVRGADEAEERARRKDRARKEKQRKARETMKLPIMAPPPNRRIGREVESDEIEEQYQIDEAETRTTHGEVIAPEDKYGGQGELDLVEWEWEAFEGIRPTSASSHTKQASDTVDLSDPHCTSSSNVPSSRQSAITHRSTSTTRTSSTARTAITASSSTATSISTATGGTRSSRTHLSPTDVQPGRPSPNPTFRQFDEWVDPDDAQELQLGEQRGRDEVDAVVALEALSGRMLAEMYGYEVQRYDQGFPSRDAHTHHSVMNSFPLEFEERPGNHSRIEGSGDTAETGSGSGSGSREGLDVLSIRSWRDVRKRSKTLTSRPMSEQHKRGSASYRSPPPPPTELLPVLPNLPPMPRNTSIPDTCGTSGGGQEGVTMSREHSASSEYTLSSQLSGWTRDIPQTQVPGETLNPLGLATGPQQEQARRRVDSSAPPIPPRAAERGPAPKRPETARNFSSTMSSEQSHSASLGARGVDIPSSDASASQETLALPIQLRPLPPVPTAPTINTTIAPLTSPLSPSGRSKPLSALGLGRLRGKRPSTAPSHPSGPVPAYGASSAPRSRLEGDRPSDKMGEGSRKPSLSRLLPISSREARETATRLEARETPRVIGVKLGRPRTRDGAVGQFGPGLGLGIKGNEELRERRLGEGITALSFLSTAPPPRGSSDHGYVQSRDRLRNQHITVEIERADSPVVAHIIPPDELNRIGESRRSRRHSNWQQHAQPASREDEAFVAPHLSHQHPTESRSTESDDGSDGNENLEATGSLRPHPGANQWGARKTSSSSMTVSMSSSTSPLSPLTPRDAAPWLGTGLSPPPRPRGSFSAVRALAPTLTPGSTSTSMASSVPLKPIAQSTAYDGSNSVPSLEYTSVANADADACATAQEGRHRASPPAKIRVPNGNTLLRPGTMGPLESPIEPMTPGVGMEELARFPMVDDVVVCGHQVDGGDADRIGSPLPEDGGDRSDVHEKHAVTLGLEESDSQTVEEQGADRSRRDEANPGTLQLGVESEPEEGDHIIPPYALALQDSQPQSPAPIDLSLQHNPEVEGMTTTSACDEAKVLSTSFGRSGWVGLGQARCGSPSILPNLRGPNPALDTVPRVPVRFSEGKVARANDAAELQMPSTPRPHHEAASRPMVLPEEETEVETEAEPESELEAASIYSSSSSFTREKERERQRVRDRRAMEEWLARPLRRAGRGDGAAGEGRDHKEGGGPSTGAVIGGHGYGYRNGVGSVSVVSLGAV